MKNKRTMLLATVLLFVGSLPIVRANEQSKPEQSKEAAKQAERESKEREKQAKEQAKEEDRRAKEEVQRQKQAATLQKALEKAIPFGIDVDYDRFKDTTRVTTKVMMILSDEEQYKWGQYYVGMYGEYTVEGSIGRVPDIMKLVFSTAGKKPFFGSSYDRTLNMIVNGYRVRVGEMKYSGLGSFGSSGYKEQAWIVLTLEDFRKLTNANSVEIQMGRIEFALHQRHLQALGMLIADLPSSAQSSSSLPQSTQSPSTPSIIGTWTLQVQAPNNQAETWTLKLVQSGNALGGSIQSSTGLVGLSNIIARANRFITTVSDVVEGQRVFMTLSGSAENDSLKGTLTLRFQNGTSLTLPFTGIRLRQ